MELTVTTAGLSELSITLLESSALMLQATVAGTLIASEIIKEKVQQNLTGSPRWGQRGKSRIYRENLVVSDARGDGGSGPYPGTFSGAMRRGVGFKKVPLTTETVVTGGVGVGGKLNNLKKGRLEEEFPFFAPAVEDSLEEIHAAYEAAWQAAILQSME